MDMFVWMCRIGLFIIFIVSGVSKLASRRQFLLLLQNSGFGIGWAQLLAVVIPLVEVITACFIIVDATRNIGSVMSLLLLVIFTVFILSLLHRGLHVSCSCFGALHSNRPLSRNSFVRNIGLLLIAAVPLLWSDRGGWTWPTEGLSLTIGTMAILVSMASLILIVLGSVALLGRMGLLLRRLETVEDIVGIASPARRSIPVGSTPESAVFQLKDGTSIEWRNLIDERLGVVFIFATTNCDACIELIKALEQLGTGDQLTRGRKRDVVLVLLGGREEIMEAMAKSRIERYYLGNKHEVAEAFKLYVYPTAIDVNSSGEVATSPLIGPELILSHITQSSSPPTYDPNTYETDHRTTGQGVRVVPEG